MMKNRFIHITDDFYKALFYAVKAHDGQYDKSGEPYILHPIGVSELLKSEDEKILAILHDIVEDTDFTLDDVESWGFGHLTEALDCLTGRRDEGETYKDFISRILTNRLAIKVKIADLKHNLSRGDKLPENKRDLIDRYNKWLPVLESELKRVKIIAAHAGTGKSTLVKRFPERYIDFVCMPYKYSLPKAFDESENESCKANPDHELNCDYPDNYIEAMMSELNKNDKILIIPPDWRVLLHLQTEEIPYILCYPKNTKESKEAYRKRYIERGNSENFLEIFIDGWDNFMKSFESDKRGHKVILKPHQYLTDVLDEIEGFIN